MKKTVLITGGSGFIGRNFKKYLQRFFEDKYIVVSPTHEELDLLDLDKVVSLFRSLHIDIVVHGAFQGVRINKNLADDIVFANVTMFENIVKASSEKTLIFNIGSGAEYDKSRALCRINEYEFGRCIPKDPYGYSKYLISKKIENLSNVTNLRVFGVFGPYEHPSRFPFDALSHNILKMPIVINRNVRFSYLFVDDLCKILEFFMNSQPHARFFNVVPDEVVDLIEISNIVNSVSIFKSEIIVKNCNLNLEYSGSNVALKKEIPFCFCSMYDAIASYYHFLKKAISEGEICISY